MIYFEMYILLLFTYHVGICSYFTRWLIRTCESYKNVKFLEKCNTEAPAINLTSLVRRQIILKHTNKIVQTNEPARKIATNFC